MSMLSRIDARTMRGGPSAARELLDGLPLAQRPLDRRRSSGAARRRAGPAARSSRGSRSLSSDCHERADELGVLAGDRGGQRRGDGAEAEGSAAADGARSTSMRVADAVDQLAVGHDVGPGDVERSAAGRVLGGRRRREQLDDVALVDRRGCGCSRQAGSGMTRDALDQAHEEAERARRARRRRSTRAARPPRARRRAAPPRPRGGWRRCGDGARSRRARARRGRRPGARPPRRAASTKLLGGARARAPRRRRRRGAPWSG